MKRIQILAIVTGILFLIAPACKLLDVTKEITFEIDLVVDDSDATFDETELLDAVAESSEIEDYKDKIKSIELIRVEYTVINFTGPSDQQINIASLDVADENGGGAQAVASVNNENLQALTSTTKELQVDPAGADRIEELILNAPHKALFHYYGNASTAPLKFTARFFVTVKMTANPLN